MSYSEQQSNRYLINELSKIKNQNGFHQPVGRLPMQRLLIRSQPAPEQFPPEPSPPEQSPAEPYEDDPVYQRAIGYFREANFEASIKMVDELLKKYPGDRNLEKFKQTIRQEIPVDTLAYREHPSYLALRQHIRRREWAAGLQAADLLLKSYPDVKAINDVRWELYGRVSKQESRTRLRLVGTVVFLTLVLTALGSVVYRYIKEPAPLTEILIPQTGLSYPPHYLFSIPGLEQPVGIGLSQDGERIYVTEMGGARMVRIFDRSGDSLGSFTSPKTEAGERAPVYVATDSAGRVYVTDRLQHAIFVFTPDGDYIDTLLGPALTLSEYVESHAGGQIGEGAFAYNLFKNSISNVDSANEDQTVELPGPPVWSPLGIRIGQDDELILTDVSENNNRIIEISLADQISRQEWIDFEPATSQYGTSGSGNGEMLFPNSAVADSLGRVYVSDGNNRRISVWDGQGNFQFNFGGGTGPGSLSLPRGLFMDWRDRLYVVDAVAQNVKVYDVSGSRPEFLFEFGDFGKGDEFFNYPNDIAVDRSGRLYIADRENHRVQVWSY